MTITTTKRRGCIPGKLTYEAEHKLQDAIQTLQNAAAEADEGTAICIESIGIAKMLRAYLAAYRG